MRTRDLNFSAFLLAHGERLKSVEPDDNGKFWFIFGDSQETIDLSDQYYLYEAQVNAQSLFIAQKKLKSLVRNYNPYNIENEKGRNTL